MSTLTHASLGANDTVGGSGPWTGPFLLIRNLGELSFAYVGGSATIDASNGYPVGPGETLTLPLDSGSYDVYAVCDTGQSSPLHAIGFQ